MAHPALAGSTTVRPLGALEHFLSLIDQHRPTHFGLVAEVQGRTRPDEWKSSLTALQFRHPLLSVAIRNREDGTACFVHDPQAFIPLRVVDRQASTWREELAREMIQPFNSRTAPLMRAVLIHGDQQSQLILTAHHAIADGLSLIYAVRDLLLSMTGDLLSRLDVQSAQEDLIPTRTDVDALPPAWSDTDAGRALPGRFRTLEAGPPHIEPFMFDEKTTTIIMERCRAERTTMHAALSAAFLLAGRRLSEHWKNNPVRCMSPVNLRRFCPGVTQEIGLFIGRGCTVHPPESERSVWAVARAVKAQLKSFETREFAAQSAAQWRRVGREQPDVPGAARLFAAAMPHELVITNLGRLSMKTDFGPLRVSALWGPALSMGLEGEQVIGAATIGGKLFCTHLSYRPIQGLLLAAAGILTSESDSATRDEPASEPPA